MRMGLRPALVGKNLLERKIAQSICSSFLENNDIVATDANYRSLVPTSPKFQQFAVRQMSSGKRNRRREIEKGAVQD